MKTKSQGSFSAPAFAAFAAAAFALVAPSALADGTDSSLTLTAGDGASIDSTSYVLVADDIGGSAEDWRCVAFSTADGDYTVTSNRLWASATTGSAIGALPAGGYIHQITSGARFDGTTTKSIRVQLAQPSGSTALYARITAVTTAAGDYSTIPDLRSYVTDEGHGDVGSTSTEAADLAANAVTSITVSKIVDCVFDAAANPTSLGGGKITIAYDAGDSAKIASIVARPTGGETLRVAGDAMTFADGATIEIAAPSAGAVAGGSLVFANDVTAPGALSMTRTDGAYRVWDWTTMANKPSLDDNNYNVAVLQDDALGGKDFGYLQTWEPVSICVDAKNPQSANDFAGSYMPIANSYFKSGTNYEGIHYTFNRWSGRHTYSVRITFMRYVNRTDGADRNIYAFLRTAIQGPDDAYLPNLDMHSAYNGNAPDGVLWWGKSDAMASGSGTYKGRAFNATTPPFPVNRLVYRRTGSATTVGFAGDVTMNGTVDVALGVKLSVLPKADGTFAAPVFTGEGDVEYQRNATLAKSNYMKFNSRLSVEDATVTVSQSEAIPTNAVVNVQSGGILHLTVASNANGAKWNVASGISDGIKDWTVHPRGELRVQNTAGKMTTYDNLVIDGGTLWAGYPDNYLSAPPTWRTYYWKMLLKDGATVKGPYVAMGNNTLSYWHVTGTGASSVGTLRLMGYKNNNTVKFFVDDTTGDSAADFIVNDEIQTYVAGSFGFERFQKYGEGTMRIDGPMSIRQPLEIYGGTLLFGDAGGPATTAAGNYRKTDTKDIVLDGGAFGKTSGALEMGAVTIGANGGVLELGPTATMSFADSSAKSWTGRLLVEGFREHAVRFGTSGSALTADQLDNLRNAETGRPLHITDSGWITAIKAFVMIVR